MTTVAAVVFMLTSISLSMITSPKTGGKSILETGQQERAKPVEKAPAAQPPSHIPTREEINREMEDRRKKEQNPPTGNQKEPPAAAKPSESK